MMRPIFNWLAVGAVFAFLIASFFVPQPYGRGFTFLYLLTGAVLILVQPRKYRQNRKKSFMGAHADRFKKSMFGALLVTLLGLLWFPVSLMVMRAFSAQTQLYVCVMPALLFLLIGIISILVLLWSGAFRKLGFWADD